VASPHSDTPPVLFLGVVTLAAVVSVMLSAASIEKHIKYQKTILIHIK